MNTYNKIKRRLYRSIYAFLITLRDQVTHYPASVVNFEKSFRHLFGAKYSVSFANGTSSLEAAMFAAKVKTGDEVILPSYSFHSGAAAILGAGAKPIYIDNHEESLSPSIEDYLKMINKNTKAILILHPWGYPYDFRELIDTCRKKQIKIIEDCSHSHGSKIDNQFVGTFGDIGCFSLQGYKSISAGEGGICITNQKHLCERLKLFGHFGRDYDGDNQNILVTGYGKKFRANPIGLAIAKYDLDRINIDNKNRNIIFKDIHSLISNNEYFKTFPFDQNSTLGGHYQGFPVLVDKVLIKKYGSVENIINFFKKDSIDCMYRPWKPLNLINYFSSVKSYHKFFYEDDELAINENSIECPNAESIYERLIHFSLEQFSKKKCIRKFKEALNKI